MFVYTQHYKLISTSAGLIRFCSYKTKTSVYIGHYVVGEFQETMPRTVSQNVNKHNHKVKGREFKNVKSNNY
jgi:hypothetical protein